jgi:hypothetical protein
MKIRHILLLPILLLFSPCRALCQSIQISNVTSTVPYTPTTSMFSIFPSPGQTGHQFEAHNQLGVVTCYVDANGLLGGSCGLSGSGTVTNTLGPLTLNAAMFGNGGDDSKVDGSITTNGSGGLTSVSLGTTFANFPTNAGHTCAANDLFFNATGIAIVGVGSGDCERVGFPPVYVSAASSPFTDVGGQDDDVYNNTGGALAVTLPDGILSDGGAHPVSMIERCYVNPVGATGVITVNTLASPANTVYLYGVSQGSAGSLVSGGALGDQACFRSTGNHHWYAWLVSGTWNGIPPAGGGGGTPASPSLSVQGNNGGLFFGIPGFSFVAANGALSAQPTADVVPLSIHCFPGGVSDCFDVYNASGVASLQVLANGNVVTLGSNETYRDTVNNNAAWVWLYGGSSPTNAGPYVHFSASDGSHNSYLYGDPTNAGQLSIETAVITGSSTAANVICTHGNGQCSGSGSGTVTSVTFTGDGVVDSSTPSTAVTTSGTVAATLLNAGAHTVLGNPTGSSAAPSYTPNPTVTTIGVSGLGTFGSLSLGTALSVANGGTGLATLTAHNFMLGEGTSNVGFLSCGTGTTVLGNSADPTCSAALVLGTDNSTAGSVQTASSGSAFHNIWSSNATMTGTNTIDGFTVVPTNLHGIVSTVSGTTVTLTDSGGPFPATLANASHKWLNSYTLSTGLFTQTQPADTDLSGTTAGAQVYVTGGALAELATTAYSVETSGATNPSWATPTANAQCFMSAASSYATTTPSFQSCPAGGTPAYPLTITGGVSGGVVYGSSSTQLTVSPAGTANVLMKWGGAGAAPANSSCDDGATTANTLTCSDSAGISATGFTATGSGAGVVNFGQGPAHSAATNSVGFQAPTTVSSAFLFTLPGAPAAGVLQATNATPSVLSVSTAGVPVGGTGLTTLTAHNFMLGEGTSNVGFLSCGAGTTVLGNASDPTCSAALVLGTDNSTAGTVQTASSGANFHNIWGSSASMTGTNTIDGFKVVPTSGDVVDCTVSSTTCTLTDSGVLAANVVNASSPGAGIAHFAGSTQTVTSSLIVAADITSATITGTQIASSIALAGSPTTTTQSACDNSTKIATTAYVGTVCNNVETSGSPLSATAQSQTIWNNTASAYSVDLPTPTASGPQICFGNYKARASALSLIPGSGVTIYFEGVAGTSGSSTGLVSGGAAGDFICLEGTDSTTYMAVGAGYGTWTNH